MFTKETRKREFFRIATIIIFSAVLAACVPIITAQETLPAITQASDSGVEIVPATTIPEPSATLENTPTPENTSIPSATATTEATATPEKTEAENMHEYCIQKAKEVGIDLDNLENSNNLWLTEHQGLEGLEEAFNTSFTDGRIFKTMIVVDVDSLNSQTRYNSAPTTAEGKKIMGWMEAIYKKADGQYQLVPCQN